MRLKPHADANRLKIALSNCLSLASPFQGDACRTASPKYATPAKLQDGAGAKKWGGRWNPPGVSAAYFSLELETAMAEMTERHRRGGIPLSQMRPRVIVSARLRLQRVLDLRDHDVRQRLGVALNDLLQEWKNKNDGDEETVSQAIGRLAEAAGLEGLVVPSVAAAPQAGSNLVVFPDNVSAWLEIYHQDELPPQAP